jgi:hypothetical protein
MMASVDGQSLKINNTYRLREVVPIMPEVDPDIDFVAKPNQSIALLEKSCLMRTGKIKVLGIHIKKPTNHVWYRVIATGTFCKYLTSDDLLEDTIVEGWINSIALNDVEEV